MSLSAILIKDDTFLLAWLWEKSNLMNKIIINLACIKKNLLALSKRANVQLKQVMPVVKSDAYGHGLQAVVKILSSQNVKGFAVSEVEEANLIRKLGVNLPILLLSGVYPGEEEFALELSLTVGVYAEDQLDRLELVAAKHGKPISIHVKVDTGMTRFGFSESELHNLLKNREQWPHLSFDGLFSHLSSADNPEDPLTLKQIEIFNKMIILSKTLGWKPKCIHLANSAASISFKQAVFDCIRPGLAIYGAYPGLASKRLVQLFPAMSYQSGIVALKNVKKDTPIGYSHSFYSKTPSKIAVVPVGYDNGYLRAASNKAEVLVKGVRCPVVGNICMKSLMIDVTKVSDVVIGDQVVLLGKQGDDEITIEELASWASTISYELLCLLGTRNKRIYL